MIPLAQLVRPVDRNVQNLRQIKVFLVSCRSAGISFRERDYFIIVQHHLR